MEIKFSGPFNILLAIGGIVVGIVVCIGALQLSTFTGPAIDGGGKMSELCRLPMLVTVAWSLVYYMLTGSAVNCAFMLYIGKIVPVNSVTQPNFGNAASRFGGNMFEQSPVFLTSLWLYAIFVDAGSAGTLGVFYVCQRLLYPLFYMVQGEFNYWFEFVTQAGYGINGVMLLGILVTGFGHNWVELVKDNPQAAPIAGFFLGSLTLFPGIPVGPIYTAMHYFLHRAYHHKPANEKTQ